MNSPDPFWTDGDDDKTILRPSPGGRRRRTSIMPKATPQMQAPFLTPEAMDSIIGDNPVVGHAASLLSVVPKLRNLAYHDAVNELLHQIAGGIQRFENQLTHLNIEREQIKIASYQLCTLIDETVLNTPWGNQSTWGNQSLLIQFHNEAKGGERFFQIIERLKSHPPTYLNLLELAYLCLSFGFEGRYRHEPGGSRELERIREDLYLVMQRTKGREEQALSLRWRGLQDKRAPIEKQVPVWVAVVVAGAWLTITYMGFAYAVNSASNLTYQHLTRTALQAARPAPIAPLASRQPPVATPMPTHHPFSMGRFKSLLAGEISRGMVEIVDDSVLRLSNSFPSGSDRIDATYVPMLEKIARELQRDNRLIMVIGHTDDQPIFSARFPSNWHLSQARARNVATIMAAAASLDGRVRFEGRSDSEPIVPNDSAANRARNRRIDIHIR